MDSEYFGMGRTRMRGHWLFLDVKLAQIGEI